MVTTATIEHPETAFTGLGFQSASLTMPADTFVLSIYFEMGTATFRESTGGITFGFIAADDFGQGDAHDAWLPANIERIREWGDACLAVAREGVPATT
ncbi:hypothetical protein GCM10025867_46220 (plasmid) [Frondihabitans sucicola]|uniref:Uncharacterized protein n=1 Tax=Frondihabitans sucicola TaxID=1268041 RepID=A0ABM8GVI0_9MICO|nr:hypothetical protein [Frondihabitans sucicola]BDZ52381.1 hypothetical protein GCM10025867_46220 [Frondihabitans sucicola]